MSRPRSARNRDLPSNLYRRRDGRFYFRDPRNGRTFALGRDAASARLQALEVNVALAAHSGRERLLDRVHGCGSRTLRAWLVRYQELTAADPGLTPTTRVQYRSLCRQLNESLGDFTLTQLQPAHIAAALGAWKAAGRWSRAAALLAHLRRVCAAAIGEGWLPVGRNPTEGLRVKNPGVRRQRLTLGDFHQLYDAATAVEPWVQRWLELAVLTTLRIGDLLGLCWTRDDQGSGFVEGHELRVRTAKRGVPIAIPLALTLPPAGPWSVESVLAAVRSDGIVAPRIIRRQREWPNAPAGSGISPRAADAVFAGLVAAAGIVIEPARTRPTPHELRSLGLRLHHVCHGRDFARHLGAHQSQQAADVYQDPRGSGWVVIPLPPRPKTACVAAAAAAAAGPRRGG